MSPRILWTCDPRSRVWEGFTLELVDMLTTGVRSGRGSLWRLWMCDTRYRFWEGYHPGDCGCVTTGLGSVRGSSLRLRTCDPGVVSGKRDTLETENVAQGTGSGRGVMQETVDM